MVMDPNVFARKFVDAFTSEFGRVGLSDFKFELNSKYKEGLITKEMALAALSHAKASMDFTVEETIVFDQGDMSPEAQHEAKADKDISDKREKAQIRLRAYPYYDKEGEYIFKGYNAIMREIRKHAQDASPLFEIIGQDFFNTNKEVIFSETGPGLFKDLSLAFYQPYKAKHNQGRIYPILVWSGDLMRSLTNRNDSMAIFRASTKSLNVGTKIEYAGLHQSGGTIPQWRGRGNVDIPMRKPVQVGTWQRGERWMKYARSFMSYVRPSEVQNAK